MKSSEAAAFLGISIASIRRWSIAGLLPHWRTPGGQLRFDRADLEAWRDSRSESAMTEAENHREETPCL